MLSSTQISLNLCHKHYHSKVCFFKNLFERSLLCSIYIYIVIYIYIYIQHLFRIQIFCNIKCIYCHFLSINVSLLNKINDNKINSNNKK